MPMQEGPGWATTIVPSYTWLAGGVGKQQACHFPYKRSVYFKAKFWKSFKKNEKKNEMLHHAMMWRVHWEMQA